MFPHRPTAPIVDLPTPTMLAVAALAHRTRPRSSRALGIVVSFATVVVLGAIFMGCEAHTGQGDARNTLAGPAYVVTEPRDVTMADPDPTNTLTGRVFNALTGAGLSGAQVRLSDVSFIAKSGADGTYRLPGIPAGSFRLEASATGYYRLLKGLTMATRGTRALDLGLMPTGLTGALDGYVLDAFTGEPLANATVTVPEQSAQVPLTPTGHPVPLAQTVTDATGHFHLSPLPAGQLYMTFVRSGYRAMEASVDVPLDQPITRTFYLLFNSGQIRGTVRSTRASNPLTAAQVSVMGSSLTTLTDSAGKYGITDLHEGTYSLEFAAAGHDRLVLTTAVVTSRITTTDVRLRYNLASLYGTVRDQNTVGLANVKVSVPSQGLVTNTDTSGYYDFGYTIRVSNPAGVIVVSLTAQNFRDQGLNVTLSPGERRHQDFTMYTQTGNLVGTILSAASSLPVTAATVRLPAISQVRITDSSGAFSFFAIPPVLYQMDVTAAGYTALTTWVPLAEGQTRRITLKLSL